jgi:hypothetical protein
VARDRATCKVALASAPIDAGHAAHSHCLVKGPERPGGYLDPPSAQEREHERDHSVGQ